MLPARSQEFTALMTLSYSTRLHDRSTRLETIIHVFSQARRQDEATKRALKNGEGKNLFEQ